MLQSLRIKNLALVDEASVEFGPGLNVITGETGAGKSILMGALSLLLGERADRTLIRSGESACSVEAILHLQATDTVNELLRDAGVDECEEGTLLIRRSIKEGGSGQNFINGSPVTLQVLKRLGRILVDMHGPHDHQSLFDVDFQRDLLDAFGNLGRKRESYRSLFEDLRVLETRRAQLEGPDETVAAEIDLLTFRIQEIKTAGLSVEEEESLVDEHSALANAQDIQQHGSLAVAALSEADGSAFDSLADAQRALTELASIWPEAEEWLDEARQAAIQVQELGNAISSRIGGMEANPERLSWLDERIALYEKMKRKHGPGIVDVLAKLAEAETKLDDLQMRGERLEQLQAEVEQQKEKVVASGRDLHEQRVKAGKKLSKSIVGHLKDLGLAHAAFAVDVTAGEPGPHGLDEIEYGFAPNLGEEMRPLRAIASSGEISRVMLASKVVLAELDQIPVLVFDEVDANVGGEMGHIIGEKLASLSEHRQVLCITHLPQVAVHGRLHLAVSKKVKTGRTVTRVSELAEQSRVEEIARMLGGAKQSKATVKHAEELLGQAR